MDYLMSSYKRQIRFNGIPIHYINKNEREICLFFLTSESDRKWFTRPYPDIKNQIYVLPKLFASSGNVEVDVYQHGRQPECAIMVEKMTNEEFEELLEAKDLTIKQFVAICLSVAWGKQRLEDYANRNKTYYFTEKNENETYYFTEKKSKEF
jgi:hypothetical protein